MKKVLKQYIPMSETAYYILLSLTQPRHGYGIIKHVEEITRGRINLGSGTVYGTLNKMRRDGVIAIFSDEERRTVYTLTETGQMLLLAEIKRIKELFDNAERYGEELSNG